MPLARFALYESGVEIYLAPTADDSEDWHDSMKHIAREARAFVLSSCVLPARVELSRRRSDRRGRRPARTRRVGDSRTGRPLSRRPALGRGGRAVRGARSATAVRGASALRSGRALPPPGRLPLQRFAAARLSTRSSPTRRVTPSESKRSSSICAVLRDVPSRSRKRASVSGAFSTMTSACALVGRRARSRSRRRRARGGRALRESGRAPGPRP